MNTKTIKIITVIISLGLFVFSLTQKCFCTDSSGCGDSIAVLLVGWMGIFTTSIATYAWYANPIMLFAGITIFKNQKLSLILSFAATILCFSFLLFDEIMANEGGTYSKITGYQIGYWAWAMSASVLLIGNGICFLLDRKRT